MQHSKHRSVTAVKDISTVSTINKIKIAIVFLAGTGGFWSVFSKASCQQCHGSANTLPFHFKANIEIQKKTAFKQSYKGQRKDSSCFQQVWIKQHTNSFPVWEWCCPLLGNPHPERSPCSSESQQIQAEAAYIFLTLESLQIAGDLGLLYPKEEVGVHYWPLPVSAETEDTGGMQFQSSSLCRIWPIDFQCRISPIKFFQGHIENLQES